MIRTITAATLALALLGAPAYAFHCPADMAKIDEALKTAELSDADLARVKELRATGEEQHEAGDHSSSVETLAQAMKILGIQ